MKYAKIPRPLFVPRDLQYALMDSSEQQRRTELDADDISNPSVDH